MTGPGVFHHYTGLGSAAGIWEARHEHKSATTFYKKARGFKTAAHQYNPDAQFVKTAVRYREG